MQAAAQRAPRLVADVWPVVNSRMNIGLLAAPAALVLSVTHSSPTLVFVLSLIALCPCAERLGFVTEQLAEHTNDTIGGLLNATFGNITELVISAFAIKRGLLRVVQLSLLGSVVSNLLLVLGTAFMMGGAYHSTQAFNLQGVGVNSSLLMLATLGMLLPSTLQFTSTEAHEGKSELLFSRLVSVVMLAVYGALLLFQLRTHRHLYDEDDASAALDGLPPVVGVATAVGPPPRARAESIKLLSGHHSSSDDRRADAPARFGDSANGAVRAPGPFSRVQGRAENFGRPLFRG